MHLILSPCTVDALVLPDETAPAVLGEEQHPQIQLETDTRIDQDGGTRILSNLQIHSNTGGNGGAGPAGSDAVQGKIITSSNSAACMVIPSSAASACCPALVVQ